MNEKERIQKLLDRKSASDHQRALFMIGLNLPGKGLDKESLDDMKSTLVEIYDLFEELRGEE